jgi:hypothetical protein
MHLIDTANGGTQDGYDPMKVVLKKFRPDIVRKLSRKN